MSATGVEILSVDDVPAAAGALEAYRGASDVFQIYKKYAKRTIDRESGTPDGLEDDWTINEKILDVVGVLACERLSWCVALSELLDRAPTSGRPTSGHATNRSVACSLASACRGVVALWSYWLNVDVRASDKRTRHERGVACSLASACVVVACVGYWTGVTSGRPTSGHATNRTVACSLASAVGWLEPVAER